MPDLRRAVQQHQALVTWLRDEFPEADEQTIADTAEGESTLDAAIAAVLREAILEEAEVKAAGELIKDAQRRAIRKGARAEKLRAICLQAAEEAGLPSIRAPDLSASIMRSKGSVVITDEAALPMRFVEMIRKPRKGDIGDALREGQEVPGAILSNSHSYWMVRRG